MRELENLLERACALCEDDEIGPADVDVHTTEGIGQPLREEEMSDWHGDSADEHILILRTLDEMRWNRSVAARKLGMILRQLRHRLQKWGMD